MSPCRGSCNGILKLQYDFACYANALLFFLQCTTVGGLVVEIKDELNALKKTLTGGSSGNIPSSEVNQSLAGIQAEIMELRANLSRDLVRSSLFSKVNKQLREVIKEEMQTVKQNLYDIFVEGKVTVPFLNPLRPECEHFRSKRLVINSLQH